MFSAVKKREIGGESERCPLCFYWLIRISCLSEITGNDLLCEGACAFVRVHSFVHACACV